MRGWGQKSDAFLVINTAHARTAQPHPQHCLQQIKQTTKRGKCIFTTLSDGQKIAHCPDILFWVYLKLLQSQLLDIFVWIRRRHPQQNTFLYLYLYDRKKTYSLNACFTLGWIQGAKINFKRMYLYHILIIFVFACVLYLYDM